MNADIYRLKLITTVYKNEIQGQTSGVEAKVPDVEVLGFKIS